MGVRTGALLAAATAAVLLTGCGAEQGTERQGAEKAANESSANPSTSASGRPSPSPTPVEDRRTLKLGKDGDDVEWLQRRLRSLSYDVGKVDGEFGPSTQTAVWAFQKVNGLKRSGKVTKKVWRAIDRPESPEPLVKPAKAERNRVEIDLRRQLLVVYERGRVALTSHISTGSGELFCTENSGGEGENCRYAGTPTGDFETGRRVAGWETSPLGRLYNPIYFNGGIAVHGAPSVPLYPASHGCVRIPMHTAEDFPDLVGDEVPVHVRDPKKKKDKDGDGD